MLTPRLRRCFIQRPPTGNVRIDRLAPLAGTPSESAIDTRSWPAPGSAAPGSAAPGSAAPGSAPGLRARPRASEARGSAAVLGADRGEPRWWRTVAAVTPAVVAAGLGLWRLTGPALWADELATWGAVRLTWSQLWELSGSVDAVLTPYYLMLKAYTTVAGTSTAALRLPSVVAATVATVVVAVLARRAAGTWAGLLAGLVFAVAPVTSRYAQEARPYALVVLGAAVSLLGLTGALTRDRRAPWVGYAAATGFTGLMHPLSGLLMLAGHGVAVAVSRLGPRPVGRRTAWRWSAAAGAGALPAVVLSVLALDQTGQVSWIRRITLDTVPAVPERVFLSAAVGGIVVALAVVGVRRGPVFVCLAAAAFVPPVLLLLAGTRIPVWVARYVLVALPALTVLAGVALTRVGRCFGIAVIGLVAVLAAPAHGDIRGPAGHSQASTEVASVISPRYRAGDVVVFPDTHVSVPWAARDIYERYLPAPRPVDVLRTSAQRTDGRLLATECPGATCLGSPPRIWVVRVDDPADPLGAMAPAKRDRISDGYRAVQRWRFPLLTVVLMTRHVARSP